MLFFSFEFMYAFLPLVGLGFYALGRLPQSLHNLNLVWLAAASLFFYSWWDSSYLALIVISIVVNFAVGQLLRGVKHKFILVAGISFNLVLLGYFKYLGFLAGIVEALLHHDFNVGAIVLPLAISFFTFQQIAWLADSYSGHHVEEGRVSFLEYVLFVVFFPQLIAGPIVHHAEVIPQFRDPALRRFQVENFTTGLAIFIIGLFKKVVLADNVAPTANLIYDGAAWNLLYTAQDTWLGVLSFSAQVYFDFSGYADMAIGLGLMFNIRLPVNFESPFRACSTNELWRRWHMTLSRFLRSYVYIPLGGSRKGAFNTYLFLMITMLVGGIWHGAGWTFALWGFVQGVMLAINNFWSKNSGWHVPAPLGWLLTFSLWLVTSVLFRAENLDAAQRMYSAMFSLGDVAGAAANISAQTIALIVCATVFTLVLPNTQRLLRKKYTPIEYDRNETSPDAVLHMGRLDSLHLEWTYPWLIYLAALAGISVYTLLDTSNVQEFIYFQF